MNRAAFFLAESLSAFMLKKSCLLVIGKLPDFYMRDCGIVSADFLKGITACKQQFSIQRENLFHLRVSVGVEVVDYQQRALVRQSPDGIDVRFAFGVVRY